MNRTTFVVFNGHTFGYTEDDIATKPFIRIFIMRSLAEKGGDPQLVGHTAAGTAANVRLATDQDFDDFLISREGYEDNPQYVWNRNAAPEVAAGDKYRYAVIRRSTGGELSYHGTVQAALERIDLYEDIDRRDGTFVPGTYGWKDTKAS